MLNKKVRAAQCRNFIAGSGIHELGKAIAYKLPENLRDFFLLRLSRVLFVDFHVKNPWTWTLRRQPI